MIQTISNIILRFSALYLSPLRSRKTFDADTLVFHCNFNDKKEFFQKFNVKDNVMYNNNPVLFKKEMVELTTTGELKLKCERKHGTHIHWDGKPMPYTHISGCVNTWDGIDFSKFVHVGGTWVVKARFPRTWAALWLLHPDYFVPSINKKHIIPEVDFAECNNGTVDNVLHYGYKPDKYSYKGMKNSVHKNDGKFHEYAVTILSEGYDFYFDGMLVTQFRSKDEEFVAYNEPLYLIMNNAVGYTNKDNYSEFLIQSVKVYK